VVSENAEGGVASKRQMRKHALRVGIDVSLVARELAGKALRRIDPTALPRINESYP